jgi:hypothetical protein
MLDRHKLTTPDRDLADYWNLERAKSTSSDSKHTMLVAIRMHNIDDHRKVTDSQLSLVTSPIWKLLCPLMVHKSF